MPRDSPWPIPIIANSLRRHRTSPRLRGFDYKGSIAAHLTLVTKGRQPFFRRYEVTEVCADALVEAALKHEAVLHAYCFMPDHAHVLVEMGAEGTMTRFVRLFKQLSGYRTKQITGQFLWQTSYHDHLLRRDEALLDVARYIWENPMRAGLVDDVGDYEWSGPRQAGWQV